MSVTASKFVTEGEKKTRSLGNYELYHMFRVLSTGGGGGGGGGGRILPPNTPASPPPPPPPPKIIYLPI